MLRGDDVGDLQRRLNALGFHAGREDAIFGPETASALREFQRNAGLNPDGIAGPRRSTPSGVWAPLPAVRSRASASVRSSAGPARLQGRRIYLSVAIGLEVARLGCDPRPPSRRSPHAARQLGRPIPASPPAQANRYDADLFLGLRAGDGPGCHCCYFATSSFRSEAGYPDRVHRPGQPRDHDARRGRRRPGADVRGAARDPDGRGRVRARR